MKIVAVMPFAYRPYYEACRATLDLPSTLFIDNTETNLGIAESWNQGIDFMRQHDADWLIIISAAMRFGAKRGLDLIEQIESHPDAQIIHFTTTDFKEETFTLETCPTYDQGMMGWHLTALRRDVIDAVGYFDTNFYPAYFEDTDYILRIGKTFANPNWLLLPIDVATEGLGHAVAFGGVKAPAEPNIAYFAEKWGRHPSADKLGEYDLPFDDENNSLAFFPPAHGRVWNEQRS